MNYNNMLSSFRESQQILKKMNFAFEREKSIKDEKEHTDPTETNHSISSKHKSTSYFSDFILM